MVDLLPHERQATSSPDTTFRPQVSAGMFGGQVAQATEQFGAAVAAVGHHWGDIVANDMVNQYQEEVGKIVNGDPQKQTVGPDGTIQADLGYLGTRGRDALDQRPMVDKKLTELTKSYMGKLYSADQKSLFDTASRRYRAIVNGTMGRHADQQGVVYATGTTDAQAKIAAASIASNADNPELVAHGASDLIDAHVKKAMILGAKPGDPQWTAARDQGKREAIAAQASAIAVNDPQRAMRIIENNKDSLGLIYDDLANRFRARAEQAQGRGVADGLLTGSAPPAGDDTKAVLRHFEGFRADAYQDNGGAYRAGYGSDTVTKADGTVAAVTPQTKVTQEDAERDLERRAALSQKAVRDKVGGEAFDALSPQAKSSLTSIAYNYGSGNIPQGVVDAAKTGDPAKIAQAIRGLAGHNNSINAGRRASEANNVAPGDAVPRSQGDLINDVVSRNLPPQAEAAAIARINKSYALNAAVETKRKAEFKQQVDDSLTEALVTGTTSNPVPESDFIRHFGAADGAAKFTDYQSDIVYSADRQSVETMSDVDQQRFLNTRMPQPGARGYAHAIQRHDKLIKEVAAIQEARRNDPAGVVSKNPAVQATLGRYDEKNPESFKAVADARLQAQEQLGIDPEYRSPITKAEALKMTLPLRRVITGDTAGSLQAVREVGEKFQKMFGDQADEAFAYALRAQKVEAEVAQQAGVLLRKMAKGEPLRPADATPVDAAQERAASERAVRGFSPPTAPGRAPLRVIDDREGAPATEPAPQAKLPPVPPGAIEYLLKNPQSQKEFDAKYGVGRGQEILKKYPVAPGLP
jgi:GH24 family phage-related lysozyme (muramidase)